MTFAIIVIVLFVLLIIFCIYKASKGLLELKRMNERSEQAKLNFERNQLEARKSRAKELATLCGIEAGYKSIEILEKELSDKAKKIYTAKLDEFCKNNGITSKILDTCSTLTHCMVSPTTFYFRASSDLGVVEHNSLSSYSYLLSLDKIEVILRNKIDFGKNKLNLSDIVMFKTEGDKQYITETSGGGVNYDGALVGGLLFGGAGAIVGSQAGTDIKTTTKEMDNRFITLYYNYNSKLQTERIVSTDYDQTVSALRQLIPQKEESVVQLASKTNKQVESKRDTTADSNASIVDELKKAKELLDSGLIEQEDFNTIKKKLLAKNFDSQEFEESNNDEKEFSESNNGTLFGANTVELINCGTNKTLTIKTIREHTGLGLVEAKRIVESTPCIIECNSTTTASALVKDLLKIGCIAK